MREQPEAGGASRDDISVSVNGKPQQLAAGTTVRGLVEALGLEPGLVAVERNDEVVPRREHEQATLSAGDQLEVVTFVGGG
jgi:sulfur carrier protein